MRSIDNFSVVGALGDNTLSPKTGVFLKKEYPQSPCHRAVKAKT